MRRLTISRRKNLVGAIQPIRFYIEDATAADLVVDGKNCRFLGELKNGEQKEFFIESSAAYVYAMPDARVKGSLRDQIPIPEGQMDVYISGKYSGSPLSPTFQFDGVERHFSDATKKTRLITTVVTVAVILALAIGFAVFNAKKAAAPKTFQFENMSITLTKRFVITEDKDFDVVYDSPTVTVSVFHEKPANPEEFEYFDMISPRAYAEVVQEDWSLDVPIEKEDGLTYFVDYNMEPTGESKGKLVNYTFIYKSKDAFWVFQFIGDTADAEKMKDDVFRWAKSVTFE